MNSFHNRENDIGMIPRLSQTFWIGGLFLLNVAGITGCATEPNLSDLRKQVQTLTAQQEMSMKQEKQILERLDTIESQLDEHDFLVGELIKTEEEASLDTSHLLGKLERSSSLLREQIEQTRTSNHRRDKDLSIRVKALETRLEAMAIEPRNRPATVSTPAPEKPGEKEKNSQEKNPPTPKKLQQVQEPENEASAFRSAYKVYLNGQYDRATDEFKQFVKHYPTAALTPQAFYYLGESLYVQKQYDPAKQALQHVVTTYPTNKYRILSLYKLGHIMLETDQRFKAQEFWNLLIQDYPESAEASRAREQLIKAGLS